MTRRPGAPGWPGVRRSGLAHGRARPLCKGEPPQLLQLVGRRGRAIVPHRAPRASKSPRAADRRAAGLTHAHAPPRPRPSCPTQGLGASTLLRQFSRAAAQAAGPRGPRRIIHQRKNIKMYPLPAPREPSCNAIRALRAPRPSSSSRRSSWKPWRRRGIAFPCPSGPFALFGPLDPGPLRDGTSTEARRNHWNRSSGPAR